MSQDEILKYLVRSKVPVDIPTLCKKLNICRTNISRAVRKLRDNNELKVTKIKQGCFIKYVISLK